MYVPRNTGANYRASLGDVGGVLSKIRKAIHKLAPRELSPTLMFKHNAAQKAKVKALETTVSETQRQAANDVENVKTTAAVQVLQAKAAPGAFSIPSPSQSFALPSEQPMQFSPVPQFVAPTSAAPSAPSEDKTTLYVGIGVAALLGVFLLKRARK